MIDNKTAKNKAFVGFSLVECCITLVLISALLSILMQQYLQIKQQYEHMNTLLDEAIETQLAIDFIRDRVRHAGFAPCRGLSHLTIMDARTGKSDMTAWDFLNNDLIIRRISESFSLAIAKPHTAQIKLDKPLILEEGQAVIVADCVHAEIHTIENIHVIAGQQYLTIRKPLFFEYAIPFYLGAWIEERFWIKTNVHHEKNLMYRKDHTDVLTPYIQGLDAHYSEGMVHLKYILKHYNKSVNVDIRPRI